MIQNQESYTAKLCAFARAWHSNTARQKIFDDYLAYDMMGKEEFDEIGQLIQNDFEPDRITDNPEFETSLEPAAQICGKRQGAVCHLRRGRGQLFVPQF